MTLKACVLFIIFKKIFFILFVLWKKIKRTVSAIGNVAKNIGTGIVINDGNHTMAEFSGHQR